MNVVGLISGGKDSIYNLILSVETGHNIVALAHLIPLNNENETDSFMYQSVGFNLVPTIAKCMEIPLFQHQIKRKPVCVDKIDYTYNVNDEVEDLHELLMKVKSKCPTVNAVSCGAILSKYQKNRVENVCKRLHLQVLAYLWNRDQKELLKEMIENGMEAILVKTASFGLDRRHIGQSIKDIYPYLETASKEFGLNICGEGGEYETITLNCKLFKYKIVLKEYEIIQHTHDIVSPVFLMKPVKWSLEKKDEN